MTVDVWSRIETLSQVPIIKAFSFDFKETSWKDQNKVQPFLANFLPLWITFCLIVVETWYLQILATYMSTIWKRVKSTSTPFKSTYIPLFVNHGGEKKTKFFAWNFTQKLIKTWKYAQLRRLAFLEHKSTQIIVF